MQGLPLGRVIAAPAFTVSDCTKDYPLSASRSCGCPAARPCPARRDFVSALRERHGRLLAEKFALNDEGAAERLAGAGQPGHHRADRDIQDVGELLVRKSLELAQDQQLAGPPGQAADR